MRLSSLCSLTAFASCALAEDAYLWTIDHGAAKYTNTQASSISPDTASSIIERRRGILNDDHLVDVDASLLREVKQYGGYQMPMFGDASGISPSKLLIRINGYTGTVSQFPSLPDLWIEDATKNLATDFKARKNTGGMCEYDLSIPTKNGVDLVYAYDSEGSACMSLSELKIQPTMLALFSTVPTADDVATKLNSLMRTLSHLSVTSNLETTFLVLPPVSKLQKTQTVKRAAASEEPLQFPSADVASSTKSKTATKTSSSSHDPTHHALPKIVPQCFSSQESCTNNTNSCSGHGKCQKAYGGCFKCQCHSTVVRETKDGGKKTVAWGGNACQKKDISVEFSLFAGLGILFTALVAGVIGALYKMGSEQLPSVLAAGVGGNKQK